MKRKIEHKLVNWVDGMEVSRVHQEQTEDYFLDALCDNLATRLTNYNYGLLPRISKNESSSDFVLGEQVTNKVELRLRRCHAVTSGGYRISYSPEDDNYMKYDISMDVNKEDDNKKTDKWDIVLGVNPFRRKPTGMPDADENPPRYPDVEPTYNLTVVPSGEMRADQLGTFYLVIGRLRYRGQRMEVDDNYIPPCTAMSSHPALLGYYDRFSGYVGSIEIASKKIIAKVQNQQKSSTIAVNANAICKDIMRYVSVIYFMHRNAGQFMEPIRIVNYYSSLAHICLSAFSFLNKNEKEELLQYFYNWNNVTPGAFEGILNEASGIRYDHNSIQDSMSCVERFLSVFTDLWNTLSNLEYIGQQKENIVVSSKSVEQGKSASSWSVID